MPSWCQLVVALIFYLGLPLVTAATSFDDVIPAVATSSRSTALPVEPSIPSPRTIGIPVPRIVVVGSANADTFLHVQRIPVEGENLTTLSDPHVDVPGGKGCTQAVAAAKLLIDSRREQVATATVDTDNAGNTETSSSSAAGAAAYSTVTFMGQFGNDSAAQILQATLRRVGVDISHCGVHHELASGRGYVMVCAQSGSVSAVVSGGANRWGWSKWERAWNDYNASHDSSILQAILDPLFPAGCTNQEALLEPPVSVAVLLQQEVPEFVNLLVATYCRLCRKDCLVLLDVGGEDRHMSRELMSLCDYITPNESELCRLVQTTVSPNSARTGTDNSDPLDDETVVAMARRLQREGGARSVLVTRGRRGSTLVLDESSDQKDLDDSTTVIHQRAFVVDDVVDETGAGDCYRAGWAVALLQRQPLYKISPSSTSSSTSSSTQSLLDCMSWASAAGACAVSRHGAVPSTPTRDQVEAMVSSQSRHTAPSSVAGTNGLRGGGGEGSLDKHVTNDEIFPFRIGSRLNSMKDRPELWSAPLTSPKDYVLRQTKIQDLSCVDFNYPQHFGSFWSAHEAKTVLDQAGLVAGAVCLRYPASMARGALNHPDESLRRHAIQLTKEAAQTARDLGCNEVVIWSAYDGYDYPFQVDYQTKWTELVDAFQECCDDYADILFSLEFKPTDENTRFFTVASTGAALLMVQDVNRTNFGLALDVGHMLMAGENPGQSIAMVGRTGKLFGIQLNDGYTRLAAEDGLMFGSVHPSMALEIMYELRRCNFAGHLYLDTFPQRTNPVAEAEYNIRRIKSFWKAAGRMDEAKLRQIRKDHDAIGALEMVNEALRSMD